MATLCDIGFETDLSELTSTVVSDGTITRTTSGLASTAGKCSIAISSGSTAARYVRKTWTALSTQTDLYIRWYWNIGTLAQSSNNAHNIVEIYENTSALLRAYVRLQWATPNWQARVTIRDNGDVERSSSFVTIGQTTFPTYMQLHLHKDASSGYMKLYSEGTEIASTGNQTFDDSFTFDELWLGHTSLVDATLTGTFSIDQIKATDAGGLIGAHSAASAPVVTIPTGYLPTNNLGPRTISGISVAAGTSPVSLVTCTCTLGKGTMTMTASGSSEVSGNGTNAISIIGGSETDINNTLATFAFTGLEPTHENVTVTVLATDGDLNDSEDMVLFNHRTSLSLVADSYADLVAAIQTMKAILPIGVPSDTITLTATDEDGLEDEQVITLFIPTGGIAGTILSFRRRRRQ